jgi:hypothetical protein
MFSSWGPFGQGRRLPTGKRGKMLSFSIEICKNIMGLREGKRKKGNRYDFFKFVQFLLLFYFYVLVPAF